MNGGSHRWTRTTAALPAALQQAEAGRWHRVFDSAMSIKWFAAIGDGNSHPLSDFYATLGDAQQIYPHVTSLSNEIDWAAIQATLNSLPHSGGAIWIPPGIYLLNSTLSVDRAVELTGAGRASTLRAKDASFHVLTLKSGATGSHLTNFQVQGAASSEITGQFAIFTDQASEPSQVTVDNLLVSGSDQTTGCNNGIKLDSGANDWIITGNRFERLVGASDGHGYGVLLGAAMRNVITENHFFGSGPTLGLLLPRGRHAVYLSAGASHNIVAHNVVRSFQEEAFPINTHNNQPASQYNHIINNTIVNGGRFTTDSAAISITGNSSYNRVAGNTIVGHHCHGIIVTDGGQGGLCIGNEVVGNSIYDAAWIGIVIMGAKNTEVRSNCVVNASQYNAAKPPVKATGTFYGIDIRSAGSFGVRECEGTKVVGNTSYGHSQRAAFGLNPSVPVPTKSMVVGNLFLAGVTPGVPYELNGVPCTFSGNVVG